MASRVCLGSRLCPHAASVDPVSSGPAQNGHGEAFGGCRSGRPRLSPHEAGKGVGVTVTNTSTATQPTRRDRITRLQCCSVFSFDTAPFFLFACGNKPL